MTAAEISGWHFLAADGCIAHGAFAGATSKKVEVGVTYSVTGTLELCEWGLHASVRPLDALGFAKGAIACYVRLSGDILTDADKMCASERTVLAMADVTRELHLFAVWAARRALMRERKAGREPDARSWNALKVKLLWLQDKASDADLEAALEAAREAAREAAWEAAREAAREAAWGAAGEAAREAEVTVQNRQLEKVLRKALRMAS